MGTRDEDVVRVDLERAFEKDICAVMLCDIQVLSESWGMDSGALAHIWKDCDALDEYTEIKTPRMASRTKSDVKLQVREHKTVALCAWTNHLSISVRLETLVHFFTIWSRILLSLMVATTRGIKRVGICGV